MTVRAAIRRVFLASAIAMSSFAAQAENVTAPTPTIEVRGESVVRVGADRIDFRISVVSEDPVADRALTRNGEKLAAVRKALTASGLAQDEIQTGQFNLQPQWSSPPRDPGPGWRPSIVGFVVEHQLAIRTRKLDRVGAALAAASNAGANSIGELQFSLADDSAPRAEAIALATRNALRDAETIATAAGVRRGRILRIVMEPSGTPPVPMQMEMRMATMAMDKAAVPIEAGAIELRAGVHVTVAIGD